MENTRNRRFRQAQSPSLERELSTSEVGTSQVMKLLLKLLVILKMLVRLVKEKQHLQVILRTRTKYKYGPKR